MNVGTLLKRVVADKQGATVIEYGLIISLVVLAIVGALNSFADSTISMWTNVSDQVAANQPGA